MLHFDLHFLIHSISIKHLCFNLFCLFFTLNLMFLKAWIARRLEDYSNESKSILSNLFHIFNGQIKILNWNRGIVKIVISFFLSFSPSLTTLFCPMIEMRRNFPENNFVIWEWKLCLTDHSGGSQHRKTKPDIIFERTHSSGNSFMRSAKMKCHSQTSKEYINEIFQSNTFYFWRTCCRYLLGFLNLGFLLKECIKSQSMIKVLRRVRSLLASRLFSSQFWPL